MKSAVHCTGFGLSETHWFLVVVKVVERWHKTQCQLCKRLAGPIFPLSWSRMFWERVSTMDLIGITFKRTVKKKHFPENWAISGMVTNNRTLCCLWISKCKTSGVPFDDSRALLHCWGLGNSIGITNSHAAITNHSQKLHCTYMSTSARWIDVPFDNSLQWHYSKTED